jgi:hypothetical protein
MAHKDIVLAYRVLSSHDIDELVDKVNAMIDDHWQPIGGVCFIRHHSVHMFCQAVVQHSHRKVAPRPQPGDQYPGF